VGQLGKLLTGSNVPDILGKAGDFRHIYVWSGIWQSTGYNSIIYIVALANVDQNLHEAAIIDGVSRFQRMMYIDFRMILRIQIH